MNDTVCFEMTVQRWKRKRKSGHRDELETEGMVGYFSAGIHISQLLSDFVFELHVSKVPSRRLCTLIFLRSEAQDIKDFLLTHRERKRERTEARMVLQSNSIINWLMQSVNHMLCYASKEVI